MALRAIEQEMRRMLSGQDDAYELARNIWKIAMSNISRFPDLMHPFWLIWGALTDWVENKPHEKSKAEEEMLRASREWLSLNAGDSQSKSAYLDRWVYDEMGYRRKGST